MTQKDDTAECRAAFEAEQRAKTGSLFLNREGDKYWYPHMDERWKNWQAAWKAAKGGE